MYCKVLMSIDSWEDAYVGEKDGCPTLKFDEETASRMRSLWTVDDKIPDLPQMNARASNGCGFCRMLRKAVLSNDVMIPAGDPENVSMTLGAIFDEGLKKMVVNIKVNSKEWISEEFSIRSEDGTPLRTLTNANLKC